MKKIISAAVLLILAASGLFILLSSSKGLTEQEKTKALHDILGRNPNLTNSNNATGDTEYKGKYISFLYPANATIYHLTVNGKQVEDKGALEYFAFDTQSPRTNTVTEVIQAPLVVTSLTDYPSVRLRQTEGSGYTQNSVTADNNQGLEFIKQATTGSEYSAFFLVNNKIYSLSVLSSNQKAAGDILNKIISTLSFL